MYNQHCFISIKEFLYINELKGKTIVIKYGGSIMNSAVAQEAFAEDLLLLTNMGVKVVIVHGGGPEISKWLNKAGIESNFINGLRVTDKAAMEIVEMVLSGNVNKQLSSNLSKKNLNTVGISGKDSNLIQAKKKYLDLDGEKIDIGFVGEITSINKELLLTLMDNSILPVIAPIGTDHQGNSYNINADAAASFISSTLQAEKLLIMTDVDGVYIDIKDPATLLRSITIDEIRKYKEEGIITGGMLPKLDCCVNALLDGTNHVHIIDGRRKHSLLFSLLNDNGTRIIREREENLCQENM